MRQVDSQQEFIKDDLPRSVLLIGMKQEQNQYSRYFEKKWLHVEHFDHGSHRKKFADCDMLFIATDHLGHPVMDKIKAHYKKHNRPLFASREGMSFVKKEFETSVFGPKVIEKIQSPDMPFELKIAYCLIRFHKPGDIIAAKEFKIRMSEFLDIPMKDMPTSAIGAFFMRYKKPAMRILTMLYNKNNNKAATKYKYHGLQGIFNEQFEAWKIWVPAEIPVPYSPADETIEMADEDLYLYIPEVDLTDSDSTIEEPIEVMEVEAPEEGLELTEEKPEEEILELEREASPIAEHIMTSKAEEESPAIRKDSSLDELIFDTLHALSDKVQAVLDEVRDLVEIAAKPVSVSSYSKEELVDAVAAKVVSSIRVDLQQIKLDFQTREESLLKKLEVSMERALNHHEELFRLSPFLRRLNFDQLHNFNAMLKIFAGQSLPAFEPEAVQLEQQPH